MNNSAYNKVNQNSLAYRDNSLMTHAGAHKLRLIDQPTYVIKDVEAFKLF